MSKIQQRLPLEESEAGPEVASKPLLADSTRVAQGLKRPIRKKDEPITLGFIHRFCSVDPITGCWNWTRAVGKSGYGIIRIPGKTSAASLHRLSWTLSNGGIPKGMCICHRCDNKKCCNPDHLFIGTHKENAQDCIRKGRFHPRRESPALTRIQVDEIKSSSKTYRELSEQYGASESTIWYAKNGQRHYHI